MSVDGRSTLDLLRSAQAYGKELVYYNLECQPEGHWSGFLGTDPEALRALAALVDDTQPPSDAMARQVDRPHLALFLAFLRLLRHPRDLINTFTRRHLEFYYEQFLRMSRKAAVPDRLHVLLRLAAGVEQARLPEGTLLRAGKDDLGRERVYRTEDELVVSRASVARVLSVYAQKETVGLREARVLCKGTREEAILRMLRIALGSPRPGDPLRRYGEWEQAVEVSFALLSELARRLDFADASLSMGLPDFQSMMRLKRRRDAADAEWTDVNRFLEKAGRTRLQDEDWRLNPVDPRDFTGNLDKALGGPIDFAGGGLAWVGSIDELFAWSFDPAVQEFIPRKLFLSVRDFVEMMQLRKLINTRSDNEWREISRILELAGRRRRNDPSYTIKSTLPLTDFAARFADALGTPPFDDLRYEGLPDIPDVEAYDDALLGLETYFHLNSVQVAYVLSTAVDWVGQGTPTEREWRNVERLLSQAHTEKSYADRREVLRSTLQLSPDRGACFRAMLRIALGMDASVPGEPSLAELRKFVALPGDFSFLKSVQKRLASGDISPEEWERVFQVVELAQRTREKPPEPVAQRETWLQLHAAEPGPPPGRWKTFGQQPPEDAPDKPPPGVMGWAMASPTLLLTQGKRTLVLTLDFQAAHFDFDSLSPLFNPASPGTSPFQVEISTAKGWLALAATVSLLDKPLRALQVTVTIEETAAATAPPSRETAGVSVSSPMLRMTLRPLWDEERGQFTSHYEPFRDLTLAAVRLQTRVEGLVPSSIQNDEAVLNAKRPFLPFGVSPAVGSRFYVGDPELVTKRLERLVFHVEWMAVPKNLAEHYANYPDDGPFQTRIRLVDHRARLPLTDAEVNLFDEGDATKPWDIVVEDIPFRTGVDLPVGSPASTWPRYFEWELTPNDFKHSIYPATATQKSLKLAADILQGTGSSIDAASYQVNPPYTPRIKTLLVDYTASTEVVLDAAGGVTGVDRLFHVHPFGASPIEAEADASGTPLLPRYDHEGELYIGLRDAKPPETVSLLFQMAEGGAAAELPRPPIEWRYLSADRWLPLQDGHLLSDTTRNLSGSGIVKIALEPALPSTRLPGGLYWIRAAVASNANSVSDTVGIHAQAVSATFVDRGNSPEHYAQKLPARSITGLVQRLAQIAAVEQPYPSGGGRPAEGEGGFYTRVSERLRHKERALTLWDYEHLVLEHFPELRKVKCLPASIDSRGTVEVIVIPGAHGQSISNPLEPKVPAELLSKIEDSLAGKCPPQATLHVRNARFVQVKVRVGVRFRSEGDERLYKALLNEELIRYLSPWAFDEDADLPMGGRIYANSIVSFIDGRDYVDYVATIELSSSEDGHTFTLSPQGDFVESQQPDSVLVAAREHEIDVIPEAGYTAESFTGINHMKVELDFIVAGSAESFTGINYMKVGVDFVVAGSETETQSEGTHAD